MNRFFVVALSEVINSAIAKIASGFCQGIGLSLAFILVFSLLSSCTQG